MAASTPNTRSEQSGWRVGSLERMFRRSNLFRWQLQSHKKPEIQSGLPDHWRGEAAVGSAIMAKSDGLGDGPTFDDFAWIRDLRAFGGSQARSFARDQIENWLINNGNWHPERWRPDLMGDRLNNLVSSFGWYGESASTEFQSMLARSIALQARCLALDWRRMNDTQSKLRALRGLAAAEAALGCSETQMQALLDLAIPIGARDLNADGGLISRMPDRQILMLRHLIELRVAASFCGINNDERLEDLISRMGALCRMWRGADGQMAHFNGAGSLSRDLIEETLVRAGARGKVLQQVPYTGFLRFSSGRSTIIMDAGAPAPVTPHYKTGNGKLSSGSGTSGKTSKNKATGRSDQETVIRGLGTLSFEFYVGQTPLVVNVGQTATDANFNQLLCSTSAHSTLALDDHNSSDIGDGRIAQISGVEMGQAAGGILAVASHDGYEPSHGIMHHRKLYLANGGGNLRGSDTMEYTGAPGEIPRQAIIRFHLHPKVSAAMLGNGRVLMKIRGNKTGWTFKAANAGVGLDTSVYFDAGVRHSCQQIVLRAPLGSIRSVGTHEIKWAFQRSDAS